MTRRCKRTSRRPVGGETAIHVLSVFVALGPAYLADAQTVRPSFDCRKAIFADERAICSDDRLAAMDQLAATTLRAMKDEELVKSLREYMFGDLKDRRACGANKMCIVDNQARLIELLNNNGARTELPAWLSGYRLGLIRHDGIDMVGTLPRRIGTCTRTKIAALFVPPAEDKTIGGSSVGYADKGTGTSYTYEPALAASAVGDRVIVCLASIPRNCPTGDDRGREYAATNLRTKGTWVLPDSRHRCGGA